MPDALERRVLAAVREHVRLGLLPGAGSAVDASIADSDSDAADPPALRYPLIVLL